uniref:C2H2-type domain-containing protein n=1 Tax=Chrysemys picta bellii TaxID=8478 RepID=A0A8C3HQ47_CHRPI
DGSMIFNKTCPSPRPAQGALATQRSTFPLALSQCPEQGVGSSPVGQELPLQGEAPIQKTITKKWGNRSIRDIFPSLLKRAQAECGESAAGMQDPTAHRGIHAQDAIHPRGKLSQRPDLATQQRLPMGQCPQHCIDCDKRFSNPSALNQHQRTHAREQPYRCSDCDKGFIAHLRRHQRTHTGELPHHCAECGKDFAQIAYLRIHQRTHTGERPYRCADCDKGFAQIAHLRIHQRTHSGEERPYSCHDCGKSFSSTDASSAHAHRGRPFQCTDCGKSLHRAYS